MAIILQIHPSSSSLDLLGPPDQSSTYSLSGHVSISFSSSHSLFEQRRAIRILLRSLVITFEGQAELVTSDAGYFATRLCSISKELVPKSSVELSNEGNEDGDTPCTWHIMFDLPIPGWLPASDSYGDCRQGFSGTQYTLYATSNYTNLEETYGPSWLSSICTPFSSKAKVIHAEAFKMLVNRFAFPPPSTSVSYPPTFYSIALEDRAPHPDTNLNPILTDIVSKIELLASVPERISVDGDKFSFALCLRAPSLSEGEASKLCVTHVSLEPQQIEQYSASPSVSAYPERFPIPSAKNQPPHKPLRDAHPIHALYDVGLLATPTRFSVEDAHSVLRGYNKVDLHLGDAENSLKCAEGMHPTKWFKMTVRVPFAQVFSECKDRIPGMGTPRLRPTSQGPLFCVKHSMRFTVKFSYNGTDSNSPATSTISYSLPLNFVRLRSAARNDTHSLPSLLPLEHLSLGDSPALPATVPLINTYNVPDLPAYSQLFHPNGDVKRDDRIPLPLYTPCPTAGHASEGEHSIADPVLYL